MLLLKKMRNKTPFRFYLKLLKLILIVFKVQEGFEEKKHYLKGPQPEVNFIHVRSDFIRADPESAKNTVKLSIFFALFGSVCVKAANRALMKLTPGYIYIKIYDTTVLIFWGNMAHKY